MAFCNRFCRNLNRVLQVRFSSTNATIISSPIAAITNHLSSLNISNHTDYTRYIQDRIIPLRVPLHKIHIELPKSSNVTCIIEPCVNSLEIEAPASNNADVPKHAARLIVTRRKKMKKHKLRKLRKKMKFEWAKRRQKRELKKEKVFQAGLIQQYKKAEAFSAEEYVNSRLDKLREVTSQANNLSKFVRSN